MRLIQRYCFAQNRFNGVWSSLRSPASVKVKFSSQARFRFHWITCDWRFRPSKSRVWLCKWFFLAPGCVVSRLELSKAPVPIWPRSEFPWRKKPKSDVSSHSRYFTRAIQSFFCSWLKFKIMKFGFLSHLWHLWISLNSYVI